jgi:hypothetical protein
MTRGDGSRTRGRLRPLGAVALSGVLLGLGACGSDGPGPTSAAHEQRVQSVPDSPEERRAQRVLSNGCRYDQRGIPGCGALLGASFGGNDDPAEWERSMGHRLAVRRTYWGPWDLGEAIRTAALDLRHHRIPWMSFKLPYSWKQMRDGEGDGWARSLAFELSRLDGPVWLALHHEPEGDGDIRAWTAMQARLAPIVRREAPNVAYTIILTGWNQLYGESRYSFDSVWPEDTRIDLVGFDVYNKLGSAKNGASPEEPTRLRRDYFPRFKAFAERHDVAWGLAETGHTDESAAVDPAWLERTYAALVADDGVVYSYFNSTLNSVGSWHLSGAKEQRFARLLGTTPRL